MKNRKGCAAAAVAMWFVLMGCAAPKDRGKSREQLVREATNEMKEMGAVDDADLEYLKEYDKEYSRTPLNGGCPDNPYILGPQSQCHPQHRMYMQIHSLVESLQKPSGPALTTEEAERISLAAFACARYNKLEAVDEIESWPRGAPWASRLLTLHQHPGKGGDERKAGAVDVAAINGLDAKREILMFMVRLTDGGMTYDRGNMWQ